MGHVAESLSAPDQKVCKLARLIDELDEEDRKAVGEFIAQARQSPPMQGAHNHFSPGRLRRAIVAAGHPVGQDTVERHLRGTCCCGSTI